MIAGLTITTFGHACGATYSQEDVERSRREQRLAAALNEEGNVPGALQAVERALATYPKNAEAHVLRGHIYTLRGDYPEAERSLKRALEIFERTPEAGASVAETRNMLGVVRMYQHRYSEAITLFRESANDPHNPAPFNAWGNLGNAYLEAADYPHAIEVLSLAIRLQPRFCVGHFLLGKAHFATDDFDHAEESFTQALEADPRCESFQDAWRGRGETRARLEHRDDAIADFQHCVALGAQTEAGRTCQRYLEN